MNWFVYILLCDIDTYYVGLTSCLKKRTRSHKLGYNIATKRYSKIKLVYSEKHPTRSKAEEREKQLKGWSQAKKKALISGNIEILKALSKS